MVNLISTMTGHDYNLKTNSIVSPSLKVVQPCFTAKTDKVDISKDIGQEKVSESKIKKFFASILDWIKGLFNKSEPQIQPIDIKEASQRLKKVSQVMQDMAKIFEEDQKRDIPIFKSIKPGTMEKLFYLTMKSDGKPVTMCMTGGSASGKTTQSELFAEGLTKNIPKTPDGLPFVEYFSQDRFYYDFSKEIQKQGPDEFFKTKNLDHPKTVELSLLEKKLAELKDGKEVLIPNYQLNGTGKREEPIPVKPAPLILVEGLFVQSTKKLRDLFDLKVFVDASQDVRSDRWWKRAAKRKLKRDEAGIAMHDRAMNMHNKFVEPAKDTSDIVINAEADFEATKGVIAKITEAITKPVSFTGLINKLKKVA